MKNKNNETNYSVGQLTNLLKEVGAAKWPGDPTMKWAYTTGVLEAMLDWENRGYSKNVETLQERINCAYLRYEQELKAEKELVAA
jgi:hypothetical protein